MPSFWQLFDRLEMPKGVLDFILGKSAQPISPEPEKPTSPKPKRSVVPLPSMGFGSPSSNAKWKTIKIPDDVLYRRFERFLNVRVTRPCRDKDAWHERLANLVESFLEDLGAEHRFHKSDYREQIWADLSRLGFLEDRFVAAGPPESEETVGFKRGNGRPWRN